MLMLLGLLLGLGFVFTIVWLVTWWFDCSSTSVQPHQPNVTIGVPQDEWLNWMLDELEAKDERKRNKLKSGDGLP